MTPADAITRIMTDKWPNNKLKFSREERIETQHVARFWSNLNKVRDREPVVEVNEANDPSLGLVIEDEHFVHVSKRNVCENLNFRMTRCLTQQETR